MKRLITLAVPVLTTLTSVPAPAQRCSDQKISTASTNALDPAPQIAASGQYVYSAWADGGNIHFNRSADSGDTWLAADRQLVDSQSVIQGQLRIAAAGPLFCVVFASNRNGPRSDIYFNRSLDGGNSWLPAAVRLDTAAIGKAGTAVPEIAISGQAVYVVWSDRRDGAYDIRCNRSLDGGATWLAADVRIDTDPAGAAHSIFPQIAVSGPAVHVTWFDSRNGGSDIYYSRSLDAGATWLAADVRIDPHPPGSSYSRYPQIAATASEVHVVWYDLRNRSYHVYYNRSADAGATWLTADVRLDSGVISYTLPPLPKIALSGPLVYVTWSDGRNGSYDIYFNRSLDAGATWLASDVRLDTDTGVQQSMSPAIVADGASVAVSWTDDRGLGSIRLNRSLDAGSTWLAEDLRVSAGDPVSVPLTVPAMAGVPGSVYALWSDPRSGQREVYFRRAPDPLWPASETVRGGTVPNPDALRPGRTAGPVLGCTWDPVVDHTSFMPGATTDVLCLGVRVDVLVPPYGSLLTSMLACLAGPAGRPFGVSIPAQPALIGASLAAQVVSVGGPTAMLTNALDIVVGNFD